MNDERTVDDAVMKPFRQLFKELAIEDAGGELIEYVLIAGLVIVGCIVMIGAFGGKVVGRWNSVNSVIP